MVNDKLIEKFIKDALLEDLDSAGDVTSHSVFFDSDMTTAIIRSKEKGTISGLYLVEKVFRTLDSDVKIEMLKNDGDRVDPMTEICRISGKIIAILSGERLILNLLQRLGGVATTTANLVSLISHTNCKLLDTRKTIPNLRYFEKKAVLDGGGTNHRFGLFDMILIKDTHVKAAGGPSEAVARAKRYCVENSSNLKIEVEIQTISEFSDVITQNPDRIMLDNMTNEHMSECVKIRDNYNKKIELEASGNVTEKTIAKIAETGVDFISVGAITHSVKALDIHLVIAD